MSRLLIPLLSACIVRPSDTATSPQTYTGWERLEFGYDASSTNCDLLWDAAGTEATILCPECLFAFDLTFQKNEAQSSNDGTCYDAVDSFTATYVLVRSEDNIGYQVGYWSDDEVSVFGDADYDSITGRFTYTSGNASYTYGAYYYTQYITGYGLIQSAESAR